MAFVGMKGMAGLAASVVVAICATAGAAQACQLGGTKVFFDEPLQTPSDGRHASVVLVQLDAAIPGASEPQAEGGRGYRVGTAVVKRTLRGETPAARFEVYLPTLTSCSYFLRGEPRRVHSVGYLVGAFNQDERGFFFSALEEFDDDGPRPGESPF